MVTAEQLARRREAIAGAPDLTALLAHLTAQAAPLLARLPPVPEEKALLSSDGGVCPEDGAPLAFDPWSPRQHRCPRCGGMFTGERHDRDWARRQHLWLAERAAHLAALAALGGHDAAGARAAEILAGYAARYLRYPNRDNVLGPSRLFFSTYLESVWICNYLSAAVLLRESGRLDAAGARGVGQVADEAATLIGEYDEGLSNRQTWNDAALAAIATWFEDENLAARAIQGASGLLAHLMRGFGPDGMWYEGENYHLFALRGFLTGVPWAREAGVEIAGESPLAARLAAALLAPARSALPDFTFPARKDSRYGVSLTQPMHLELWEVGRAEIPGEASAELARWLTALYGAPAPAPELYDAYLHDAPLGTAPAPAPRGASRRALSWWALLFMPPTLPADAAPWSPPSVLLESQGLAVLRAGTRYVSLECGAFGGGHGHPDRLHLTLHADGVHWLADPGTGSYVTRDLFWYRSTLAHNAPRLDGVSQPPGDATCEAFAAARDWAWARGRYGDVSRTVVAAPGYVLDIVELASRSEHVIELPWHFQGRGDVALIGDAAATRPGTWTGAALADEFLSHVERLVPAGTGTPVVELAAGDRALRAFLVFQGELLRADGPGLPGRDARQRFYLIRARGRGARCVTVLEPVGATPLVQGVRVQGSVIEVATVHGVDRHAPSGLGWEVSTAAGPVRLGGAREPAPPLAPLLGLELDRPRAVTGAALRVSEPPPLDGSLDGFDLSEPLELALEDQYRRSEEPFSDPQDFSAIAYAAWDDAALYLAVEVTKPDLYFRPPDAPPLRLDNEPDDIHSDGLQLYLRPPDAAGVLGFLVVPEGTDRGALRVRGAGDTPGAPETVRGAWRTTSAGYRVTLAIGWPPEYRSHVGAQVGFDLLINEMLPDRVRRAGQLVWSGGNGWIWLRGDRQEPERIGLLELVG
jgi:hypothetical protein